jgi:hypothetical protein
MAVDANADFLSDAGGTAQRLIATNGYSLWFWNALWQPSLDANLTTPPWR